MNTQTVAGRLEALKRSLMVAHAGEHPEPSGLDREHRALYDGHMQGLKAGLQIAINAIEAELRLVAVGEVAMAAHAQPQ